MLEDPELEKKELFCYTSDDQHIRTNICFLFTAFSVLVLKTQADTTAARVMVETYPNFLPFQDIDGSPFGTHRHAPPDDVTDSNVACVCVEGNLSITSCLFALEKAVELGWYDWRTFDVEQYEELDQIGPPEPLKPR